MGEKEKEQEKLLREIATQLQSLNEKIDNITSHLSHGLVLKETKKGEYKKMIERSSNFAYVTGGVVIAVASLLFGFAQVIGEGLFYQGQDQKFDQYWLGCGMVLASGLLFIMCGYIQGRYSNEVGLVRKFSIFGHKNEIIFNWKRDVPITITGFIALCGIVLVALALA